MVSIENLALTLQSSTLNNDIRQLVIPLEQATSCSSALRIKKDVLEKIALINEKVDIIFELSQGLKLDSEIKEILFSLSTIRGVRKVAFVGNTAAFSFPYKFFNPTRNIRNCKTIEKANNWFAK